MVSALRRPLTSIALLGVLALASACGAAPAAPAAPAKTPSASSASTATAPAATASATPKLADVTLRLDVTANGAHAPFFVALAKGYYKDEGLDLTKISDGTGSIITAEDVAAGHDTFGVASADSAAGVISKGGPIVEVADIYQNNPGAILFPASAPIHKPTDLYGMKVGAPPGTTAAQLWEAFMAAAHLNPQRIQTVGVSFADQVPALVNNQVQAESVFYFGFEPLFAAAGVKTRAFFMSDYGVDDLGSGIVVRKSLLTAHPDWVRGFVAATIKGVQWSAQHPSQAVAIERRYRPQIQEKSGTQELVLALKLLHTKASAHDPLGYMTRKDWQATVSTAHRFEGMTKVLPLTDYYTNAFLPSSS